MYYNLELVPYSWLFLRAPASFDFFIWYCHESCQLVACLYELVWFMVGYKRSWVYFLSLSVLDVWLMLWNHTLETTFNREGSAQCIVGVTTSVKGCYLTYKVTGIDEDTSLPAFSSLLWSFLIVWVVCFSLLYLSPLSLFIFLFFFLLFLSFFVGTEWFHCDGNVWQLWVLFLCRFYLTTKTKRAT